MRNDHAIHEEIDKLREILRTRDLSVNERTNVLGAIYALRWVWDETSPYPASGEFEALPRKK